MSDLIVLHYNKKAIFLFLKALKTLNQAIFSASRMMLRVHITEDEEMQRGEDSPVQTAEESTWSEYGALFEQGRCLHV